MKKFAPIVAFLATAAGSVVAQSIVVYRSQMEKNADLFWCKFFADHFIEVAKIFITIAVIAIFVNLRKPSSGPFYRTYSYKHNKAMTAVTALISAAAIAATWAFL